MEKIVLNKVVSENNIVKFVFSVSDNLKRYFTTDTFFIEYEEDISEVPIDLYDAYLELKAIGDNNSLVEANYKLHMLSNLAIGMMNQDGITIFTQSAKVIGFHYIVENNVPEVQGVLGGARTKAYEALCRCPLIRTVFMRKQEGETKIHQNYE